VDPIIVFFFVMLVFMYLLLIRPQRQQAKRHQEMLRGLAVGDEVITTGGIYGEITAIDDERVQLEIDADVRVAVSRRAIASRVSPEDAARLEGEPLEAPEPLTLDDPAPVEEQARR